MNKSQIFKAAHQLTKATIQAGDCYRVNFSAALKIVIAESKAPKTKAGVSICTYNSNFLVRVPFAIKDSFKKAVKGAKWCPETKEWFVPASQKDALYAWANAA